MTWRTIAAAALGLEWDQLTPWYNLIVPFVVAGAILVGSDLPRRWQRLSGRAAA